jgi:hypothetical protein
VCHSNFSNKLLICQIARLLLKMGYDRTLTCGRKGEITWVVKVSASWRNRTMKNCQNHGSGVLFCFRFCVLCDESDCDARSGVCSCASLLWRTFEEVEVIYYSSSQVKTWEITRRLGEGNSQRGRGSLIRVSSTRLTNCITRDRNYGQGFIEIILPKG